VVIHVFGRLVGDSGVDRVVFAYSSSMPTTFVLRGPPFPEALQ
jgi:hypothetical protein